MINVNLNSVSRVSRRNSASWFVRPSGSTYGLGNGTSFNDAWSGLANVGFETIGEGDTLYILGQHNEFLIVENDNLTIKGDYSGITGVISGGNLRTSCLSLTGRKNVRINTLKLTNATVSCLHLENASGITTNSITCSFSGNQGIQHMGKTIAIHHKPTLISNTDDGISSHDDGNIKVYGGVFSGNTQQINIVGNSILDIYESPSFVGTSTYDLYSTNGTTANSCIITMHGGSVRNVNSDINGLVILNDVTVNGTTQVSTSTGAASLTANRSIFKGSVSISGDAIGTFNNCRITTFGSVAGLLNLSKCYVKDEISLSASGKVVGEYTKFDGTGLSTHLIDTASGSTVQIKYSIFRNIPANQFGIAIRTGINASSYVNNCNFIGSANVGRGLYSQASITTNNNLFNDLDIGYFRAAGTATLNNTCFFDNNTAKSGAPTSNNEVTGDPKFADAGNDDYSLLEGSSCHGTGRVLSESFAVGILSADWGDENTVPTIVTTSQSEAWNIGAFV